LIDVYARQTEVLGSDHVETLETANSLAVAYGRNGDLAAATNVTLEALEARRRVSGEGHQGTLAALSQLADLYERQGRMDAAEKYHLLAIDAARKHLPEGHLFRGVFPLRYARYLITALRYEEAEELGLEAHGYLEQHFGAEHTWTQQAVLLVTNVYLAAGKTEEVRAWRDAHTQ